MTAPSNERLLVFSAVLALLSFAFMAASAISVSTAMSIGIGLGVASLAVYGWAVLRDMNKAKLFGGENETETRGS